MPRLVAVETCRRWDSSTDPHEPHERTGRSHVQAMPDARQTGRRGRVAHSVGEHAETSAAASAQASAEPTAHAVAAAVPPAAVNSELLAHDKLVGAATPVVWCSFMSKYAGELSLCNNPQWMTMVVAGRRLLLLPVLLSLLPARRLSCSHARSSPSPLRTAATARSDSRPAALAAGAPPQL